MRLEKPNDGTIRPPPEILLPVSHDWEALGTGGGIGTFLKAFLRLASEWNLQVTVLCAGAREASRGSVHYLPIMSCAPTELAFVRRLRRLLVTGEISLPKSAVVFANTEHYAWAFRGLGLPIVLMSHGVISETLRMRYSKPFVNLYRFLIERYAVAHACSVVVVNADLKNYYLERYPKLPRSTIHIVPIGVDLPDLEERPRSNPFATFMPEPRGDVILFVGRLYPEKNLPLFLKACDNLKQRGDRFEAVVIGDGIESDAVVNAMPSRRWLHWIPKMSRSEVLDAMALARVLVICSRYEAGPLVLLEALGLGTAVVTTNVGRARELVADGLGQVVNSDPDSFSDAIHDVLSQSSLFARQGRQRIWERIDFQDTMGSLFGILQSAGRVSGKALALQNQGELVREEPRL